MVHNIHHFLVAQKRMVYCQLFASAFRNIDRCDVAGMDRGQDRRSGNGIPDARAIRACQTHRQVTEGEANLHGKQIGSIIRCVVGLKQIR